MRLFKRMKDGGPLSKVHGFFLVEIKSLFSIVLLRFDDGARDAFHTHAFNAWSWVLDGCLVEEELITASPDTCCTRTRVYTPSLRPIYTPRECFHKVTSFGTTWALTFRGPWVDKWLEYTGERGYVALTHGRKEVDVLPSR
jgi:hypothetical protein